MAAGIGDKFKKAYNSGNPNVARVTTTRTAGALTLACDNLAGWPTDTAVDFSTYRLNTSNAVIAGTQIDWKGIVSGNNIGTLTRITGATDTGSTIGDVVEMNPTGNWATDLVSGILVQHTQAGAHGAVTATSVVSAGAVTGTTLTGTSLVNTGDSQLRSVSLETIRSETQFDYIATGGVWSGDSYASTLNGSMTALTCYQAGRRGTIGAVTAHAFTASKDTYIDILNTAGVFTLVYTEVNNNAASPALAANSIRLAIVVSGAGSIAAATSVNQGQESMILPIASSIAYSVTDSLGNLICPRDPQRRILGYRRILSNATQTATSATLITGLSAPFIIPTARKYEAELSGPILYHSVNNTAGVSSIWEGTVGSGTQLAESRGFQAGGNGSVTHKTKANSRTPSSTSITVNAGLHAASAGTATAEASSTAPLELIIRLT